MVISRGADLVGSEHIDTSCDQGIGRGRVRQRLYLLHIEAGQGQDGWRTAFKDKKPARASFIELGLY